MNTCCFVLSWVRRSNDPIGDDRLMSTPLPTFLIVGAMRSGTTSLARYLGAHPGVYMAPEKEVHFFDRHFDRGLEWYASRFPGADTQMAIGEATQVYMYDPLSVGRIVDVLPHAKLIAILRDPAERAYSHYRLNRSLGTEDLSFREALRAEPDRVHRGDRETRFAYSYVDRGRYLSQLDRMSDCFSRRQVHVVLFEEMRSDPTSVYRSLCNFLGIDPSHQPSVLGRPINQQVAYRSLRARRFARALPRPLGRIAGRVNRRRVIPEPMDDESRGFLHAQFSDDLPLLADWIGRPPPWLR